MLRSVRPVVYVAGKFRGHHAWQVEKNVQAAEAVAWQVAEMGMVPLCPHTMYRNFDKSLPDQFWLDATSVLLTKCDAMILVKGRETSKGTASEMVLAHSLRIEVFETLSGLQKWFEDRLSKGERNG